VLLKISAKFGLKKAVKRGRLNAHFDKPNEDFKSLKLWTD